MPSPALSKLRSAAVLAVLGAVCAGGASGASTPVLRLDGVAFRPELALTPSQRQVGLMHRRKAPADGMLFVFPRETSGGFWMKNTRVPLTIVFFGSTGDRVRKLSMTPCATDPCPLYYPRRSYRFALELPASDERPAKTLRPSSSLRLLARRAS